MAKKPAKETSIPLVIALVFFVLTTIAFGVMWYMQMSDQEAKAEAVKKANSEKTAAAGEAADALLEARILRLIIGVEEEKDKESIASETKNKDKITAKVKKFNDALVKSAGVEDYSKLSDDLKIWPLDDKGGAAAPPDKGFLPLIGDLAKKRNEAIDNAAKAKSDYNTEVANLGKERDSLKAAQKTFTDKAAALPKQFDDRYKVRATEFDDRTKGFITNEAKSRDEISKQAEQLKIIERERNKFKDSVVDLQKEITGLTKAMVKKQDTFQYEEPQGKITRRLPEGVVEINLGSDALVRPGLTFMVLPGDYPEKGRQSRIRKFRVANDQGEYKDVERFVEKGSLEVIEVLGPKLSRCRITDQAEPIRDAVGPGDLLYNVAWRKGMADHIALIGIFDLNGDGPDDIENVVRDLLKMGIPVDAYFDLKTKTWKGQIDTQTRFIVRGALPSTTGANDPRRDEKSKIYSIINNAIEEAQKKGGAQPLDYRDFFPRMGYRVKLDVSPDKINQAATPYLRGVTVEAQPASP